ncbi:PSD1 and planctomycete cytochrome C domain-containing protein [bacterium]|nr:PSD1 and planctomycete cytochrome C domain-containing protein [bacterium]
MNHVGGTWILLLAIAALAIAEDPPAAVDFARDVMPILQARCASCHGSDKQESGLRLDGADQIQRGGDNYSKLITAGDRNQSPLFQFMSREDADLRMPPKGDQPSSTELDTIGRWIDQGAHLPIPPKDDAADGEKGASAASLAHWAYQPVVRPATPGVIHPEQSEGLIDRFIQERLDREGLSLQPIADPRTIARRLWFDLIGLPPEMEDIERLTRLDHSDQFEREVDHLLASPRFGERWARHWLDVVRFAETNGFEMNQPRLRAWPYRDYVIESANIDRPYDEFVRQQIAGDMLAADEATGFLVGGPWDQVKSPDPALTAQQRADELHDMVSTTGSAFLGLTVGCARCHRHKFDPISQTDYYRLKASLEGVKHGERMIERTSLRTQPGQLARWKKESSSIRQIVRRSAPPAGIRTVLWLDDTVSAPEHGRIDLIDSTSTQVPLQPGDQRGQVSDEGSSGRLPTLVSRFRQWNATGSKNLICWRPMQAGTYRLWVSWGAGSSTGAVDASYWLDRDGRLETTGDQVSLATINQQQFADGSAAPVDVPVWSGMKSIGTETLLAESCVFLRSGSSASVVTASSICFEEVTNKNSEGTMPSIRSPVVTSGNVERFEPQPARFVRMTIESTNSAEPCLDELEVFSAEAEPRNLALASAGASVTASSTFPGHHLHQLAHLHDGEFGNERSWISGEPGRGEVVVKLAEEALVDTVVWGRDQTDPPKYDDRLATRYHIDLSLDGKNWKEVASHRDRFPATGAFPHASIDLARQSADTAKAIQKQLRRRKELIALLQGAASSNLVYSGKFDPPGPTHRLHRGDPLSPREEVSPGVIESLGPKADVSNASGERDRRQMLAGWITDPAHPLPWRVIANRLWQQHLGEGIVATPSDFGLNGIPPTHPVLLDLLATELADHDYRLKHLHRFIVTSRTYRQKSQSNSEGMARDGASRLYWRYPPRRLDAEPLRDTILYASGNLDLSMGGVGFSLFEPNDNYVRVYKSKTLFGPAEWRRMIYQTKIRMQLDSTFGAFDCPDAGQIAPKRSRSITPLQALNLLHSGFILQQAKILADRATESAGKDPIAVVERMFEWTLQRPPDDLERQAALQLIDAAGLEALARGLFNTNEFLMID